MDMMMTLCEIITGINIILILSLLFIYVNSLSRIRSGFTAGLVMFAGLFLLHDIVIFYSYLGLADYYVPDVKLFVFTFSLLQAMAFTVLNFLSWK